jgi:hypothetical protein
MNAGLNAEMIKILLLVFAGVVAGTFGEGTWMHASHACL